MTIYLDSSAIVKLGVTETHTSALRARIAGHELVASDVARIEVARAIRRHALPDEVAQAATEAAMSGVYCYADDRLIQWDAGLLAPATIRSLDAIHLVTAQRMAPELEAFISYDERMLEAASALGLPVETPRD